jgi:glycosyltransferase involved in cell wall biosynthesis
MAPHMPNGAPWPLISIVTPSLNQGRFIEHAIRSVLAQGYPRLELIVMDGGSSDDTVATLTRYKDSLTHWESAPDGGPADALNRGFGHANGDILGFLNADDFYLPGSLETIALAFADRPNAEVISGHAYFANPAGELGVPVYSDPWHPTRFRYGACLLIQQATFFRRTTFDAARGFRLSRRTSWDMELWADMAKAGARFDSIGTFLAAFRLHPDSITGSARGWQKRVSDAHYVLEHLRGRPTTSGDRVRTLYHRARRFMTHPLRSARQRLYFHSTLGRWSL